MINELFPFQKSAVNELRVKTAMALNNYRTSLVPQVISLQAPTGSGKTIIMASFIEDIYYGSDTFAEQPEAIFVWLSDSPQLNEQSKQKIEQKADRIRFDQCVVISDESFDQEILEDGHIYFLNTQKLGKAGNLSYHSDTRQYTIWETIENTTKHKSDRLYFVIDEAHRGMQGKAAGTATTIMQRFIKGSSVHKLSPVPVVIGMSATADRFNKLVGDTTSTLNRVIISPAQVRASGLLKDRIVITYPEDPSKHGDMAVLQAATDEWISKCQHWYQYTTEQHYSNVNPVFVIQVTAGTGRRISDTDLDDVIAKVEERLKDTLKDGEVVHTFGSIGTIQINGLNVPHVEPSEIAENRKIRVVLFKENLSTGWDCPRAETMMSFRHAEDATYIAQLLGRMVRTPLQCHIMVDDSLNDVRLFLPYFNRDTVQNVIKELQSAEGGDIPTVIDGESLEEQVYVPWTVHTRRRKIETPTPGQMDLSSFLGYDLPLPPAIQDGNEEKTINPLIITDGPGSGSAMVRPVNVPGSGEAETKPVMPQKEPLPIVQGLRKEEKEEAGREEDRQEYTQISLPVGLDREEVIRFINEQGFLTYIVRSVRINNYLKSLLSLAGLLTQNLIYANANDEVKEDITNLIHDYVNQLHMNGKYDDYSQQVLELKLSVQIFDVFGEALKSYELSDYFAASETDIDRQLRFADAKLGGYGFPFVYGRRFFDPDNPNAFKIDCILFAADDDCMAQLNRYAENKFHEFNDKYRKYLVNRSERCRKQYSDIIADGDIVSKHNFTLPETISAKIDKDGKTYFDHLFAAEDGSAVIKLNGWEEGVLEEERKDPDFVCWLRNPPRQSWSLRIPYEMEGTTKEAFPDFLIVRRDSDLGYVLDILEPHNPDFKDNLAKAKGFAKYAAEEMRIGRIELIRTGKDAAGNTRFKRLDMGKGSVRNKVLTAVTADEFDHIFETDGEFKD